MKLYCVTLITLATLFLTGCSSPLFEGSIFDQRDIDRKQSELAQIKTSSDLTNIECQRLSEQIQALSHNQQMIDNRLRGIEAQLSSGGQTQQEVATLRRELEGVRADREKMRSQIAEDLASKIEKVAAQQQKAIQAAQSQPQPAAVSANSPSSSSGSGYEHKVERGQTLSEIARGYNTTVSKIIKANNIKDASTIRVGQTLFIPD